jgi:Flp pilus assembly protein TadB
MRKWCSILALAVSLMVVPGAAKAQEGISRKQQERIQAKKAKDEKKAKARQERDDRKRHLNIQDKATRKRIKRHTKRADRRGSGPHRDGFFRRTFGG